MIGDSAQLSNSLIKKKTKHFSGDDWVLISSVLPPETKLTSITSHATTLENRIVETSSMASELLVAMLSDNITNGIEMPSDEETVPITENIQETTLVMTSEEMSSENSIEDSSEDTFGISVGDEDFLTTIADDSTEQYTIMPSTTGNKIILIIVSNLCYAPL